MSLSRPHAAHAPPGTLARMDGTDRAAVAALHERYLEEVFRYVLQRVPRLEEAEDITAEVFAAAVAALPRFRGHCSPRLWLLAIARRKVIDARRRRSARPETLASELADDSREADALWQAIAAAEGPEAVVLRQEARRILGDLVAGLHPDQREALMLKYLEQLAVAEIAVVMDRTPSAVYSLLKRARATLQRRGSHYFLRHEEERES